MNDNLSLETALTDLLNQAAGYPRNGGIRHAEPEDIGIELGTIESGHGQSACQLFVANCGANAGNDHLVQPHSGDTESVGQRAAPVA